jgi:hypothetical protein
MCCILAIIRKDYFNDFNTPEDRRSEPVTSVAGFVTVTE